jgi:hypothetical protein
MERRAYGEGAVVGFDAVAAVVCDLVSAGAFRTIAIPADAREVENCCALHLEVCFRAQTALLTGYDRSILKGGGKEWSGGEEMNKKALHGSMQTSPIFWG